MSVVGEPEIGGVVFTGTTNAAALTIKGQVVLAAAGAGLRYRIYSIDVGFDMSAAAPANIVNFLNAVLGVLLSISIQQPSAGKEWPGGNPLATNGALNMSSYASAAVAGGIPITIAASYVVEAV